MTTSNDVLNRCPELVKADDSSLPARVRRAAKRRGSAYVLKSLGSFDLLTEDGAREYVENMEQLQSVAQ